MSPGSVTDVLLWLLERLKQQESWRNCLYPQKTLRITAFLKEMDTSRFC